MQNLTRAERGYSLVEMVVSMGIMVVVTGAIFSLTNPNQGISRVQPEFSDMQQRARVGADTLTRDLMMAGAGPYLGSTRGSLTRYFPPILPYRGGVNPDPAGSFRTDAVTLVYVPNTSAQTIARERVQTGGELKVEPQDHCEGGKANQLCGFTEGMSVLIFDAADGAYDTFEITHVQDEASMLQHRGVHFSKSEYGLGAVVTQVDWYHYYWDRNTLQLRRYDGIASDVPILDNVVDLRFEYYGDPNPPIEPRLCVTDGSGNPIMQVLVPVTSGSLVKLDDNNGQLFRDMVPTCGGGTNAFDADLLRIRQVRVRLRVQASDPAMRPRADALAGSPTLANMFRQPGTGVEGSDGFVPDYEVSFEVTPRNLNLAR